VPLIVAALATICVRFAAYVERPQNESVLSTQ
jgi:hypothetical protein